MTAKRVLVHAIGLDRELWSAIAQRDDLCIDLPGHGTAPAENRVSMKCLASYVADRIDAPADVIGVSLGGMVALHLAVDHPEKVRSLVVSAASAASKREVMVARGRDVRSGGMSGVLRPTLERWFTPAVLERPEHPGVAYARRRLLADDPVVFAQYWDALADHDVASKLEGIAAPVTLVAGRHDASVPLSVMEQLHAGLSTSRLVVLDTAHMPPLEAPEEFSEVLSAHHEWIARIV